MLTGISTLAVRQVGTKTQKIKKWLGGHEYCSLHLLSSHVFGYACPIDKDFPNHPPKELQQTSRENNVAVYVIISCPFDEKDRGDEEHAREQDWRLGLEYIFSLGLDVMRDEAVHYKHATSSNEPTQRKSNRVGLIRHAGHVATTAGGETSRDKSTSIRASIIVFIRGMLSGRDDA